MIELLDGEIILQGRGHPPQHRIQDVLLLFQFDFGKHRSDNETVLIPANYIRLSGRQR